VKGASSPGVVVLALAVAAGAAGCGGGTPAATQERQAQLENVVNVYNWADYIGPVTIADFQAKTGIRVNYDTYDSSDLLETKLLTGRTGYDVVVPTLTKFERLAKAGAFRPLDKSLLPNLANMDPWVMRKMAGSDADNRFAIPYMWGTVGIGYVPAQVERVLGIATLDSWGAVFDPAFASKLAACGIVFVDSADDVFGAALIYLGRDPNSQAEEDLAAAEALLRRVQPFVRYFGTGQAINDLASGEICVWIGYNGDVVRARARGAQALTPVQVAYANPREGSMLWLDAVAIPADAPNPENAHAFLNYLMEPEVIAAISGELGYAHGNTAALAVMDESLTRDPAIYPPMDSVEGLHLQRAHTATFLRALNRAWTRIKAGL